MNISEKVSHINLNHQTISYIRLQSHVVVSWIVAHYTQIECINHNWGDDSISCFIIVCHDQF